MKETIKHTTMSNESKKELLRIITELFVNNFQQDVLWKQKLDLKQRKYIDDIDVALYGLQKALNNFEDKTGEKK